MWIEEFPDPPRRPGHLERPAAIRLGGQGVAIAQPLRGAAGLAEEGSLRSAGVGPDRPPVPQVDFQDPRTGPGTEVVGQQPVALPSTGVVLGFERPVRAQTTTCSSRSTTATLWSILIEVRTRPAAETGCTTGAGRAAGRGCWRGNVADLVFEERQISSNCGARAEQP